MSRDYASLEISNLNKMFSDVVRLQQEKIPNDLSDSFGRYKDRLKILEYPDYYISNNSNNVFKKFKYLKDNYGCRYAIKRSLRFIFKKIFKKNK